MPQEAARRRGVPNRFARRMGGGLAGSRGAGWSARSEGGFRRSMPRSGQSRARADPCPRRSQLPPPWPRRPGFIHSGPGDSELGPLGATARNPARRPPPPPLHFADWENRGGDSRPRSLCRSGASSTSPHTSCVPGPLRDHLSGFRDGGGGRSWRREQSPAGSRGGKGELLGARLAGFEPGDPKSSAAIVAVCPRANYLTSLTLVSFSVKCQQ